MLQTGFVNSRPEVSTSKHWVFRISTAFPVQSEQEISLLRTMVSAAFSGIVDIITHKNLGSSMEALLHVCTIQ